MKDLTQVDGVKVIEREQARMDEHSAPNPSTVGNTVRTVDVIMLADSRVLFQCMHPDDEDCVYTAVKLKSVTAHQVKHGPGNRLRAAERELEQRRLKEQAEFHRRSEGVKRGKARAREQRMHQPIEVTRGTTDVDTAAKRVIIAFDALNDAAAELQKVLTGFMRLASTTAAENAENGKVPTEVAAKAEKWDKYVEFRKLIDE